MDFVKNARKVATPIRKAISLDLNWGKYFDQYVPTDLANRFNNWKNILIQKCIIKHTNNRRADYLQLQKEGPKDVKIQWKCCP